MSRTTNAVATRRRVKRLCKKAKGFFGDRKNHIRQTKNAVMKAMAYNYCHRKQRKRTFRSIWITRLGIAAKRHGMSYSVFVHALNALGSQLNRKILSELAIHDSVAFASIATKAYAALPR